MTNPTKAAEAPAYHIGKAKAWMGTASDDGISEMYEIAVKALLDAKQRGDDGWLPIETLDHEDAVLLFDNDKGVLMGWKNSLHYVYLDAVSTQGRYLLPNCFPTHWRHLPCAPKETT